MSDVTFMVGITMHAVITFMGVLLLAYTIRLYSR